MSLGCPGDHRPRGLENRHPCAAASAPHGGVYISRKGGFWRELKDVLQAIADCPFAELHLSASEVSLNAIQALASQFRGLFGSHNALALQSGD